VNGTVNVGVNRAFHGAFTSVSGPFEIGTVVADVNGLEIDGVLRLHLAELLAESLFGEVTGVPRGREAIEALAMETAPGLAQKFEIVGDRNDVLAVLPFAPYFEIPEQLGGDVGFERFLYRCAEALFSRLKMGSLGRDVKEAKRIQLPKRAIGKRQDVSRSRSRPKRLNPRRKR